MGKKPESDPGGPSHHFYALACMSYHIHLSLCSHLTNPSTLMSSMPSWDKYMTFSKTHLWHDAEKLTHIGQTRGAWKHVPWSLLPPPRLQTLRRKTQSFTFGTAPTPQSRRGFRVLLLCKNRIKASLSALPQDAKPLRGEAAGRARERQENTMHKASGKRSIKITRAVAMSLSRVGGSHGCSEGTPRKVNKALLRQCLGMIPV